ncbi:FxLD family lanthipeptide [Streptomyces sp. PTY087I2]
MRVPLRRHVDLDVSVIESGGAVEPVLATDGGCGASCGNACASNVA